MIHGLRMIADSLTHLTLYECPFLQLRDILETCHNLVSLKTMHVNAIMPLSSSSIYPKMTHLALYSLSDTEVAHGNMVDILSRFPSLRVLEISPMPSSSILSILHQHCPHLQMLYYGISSCFSDDTIELHPNRKGLALACIGANEGDIVRQDDLVGLLHMHIDSLEKFEFRGTMDVDGSYWKFENGRVQVQQQADNDDDQVDVPLHGSDPTLPGTFFMRLTSMLFSGTRRSLSHGFMLWMVSNAPYLSAISLLKCYFQPDIANAMIKAKHLSKLEIFHSLGYEGNEGIKRFLDYHIAMGDGSTLEEVIIRMVNVDTTVALWIRLLSRLKCLKNLKLLVLRISEDCIPVMEEIGQGCPALKEVTLGHADSELAHGLIKPLCKHPNIESLRIGTGPLSHEDLMDLCAFNNLKQLQLQFTVADRTLKMLRDHIHKVEIT